LSDELGVEGFAGISMDFQDKIDMKNDHEYAKRKMAGRGNLYSGFEGIV